MEDESLEAVKKMFPDLTPEEQIEAAFNLSRYVRAICGTYEGIQSDPEKAELLQKLLAEKE